MLENVEYEFLLGFFGIPIYFLEIGKSRRTILLLEFEKRHSVKIRDLARKVRISHLFYDTIKN